MPDIRITGLIPVTQSTLDTLELDLQVAAAMDEQIGLVPENFNVFFVSPLPTASRGRVVMVEVIGLFEASLHGRVRTKQMRDDLLGRLGATLNTFAAVQAPSVQQIHLFCPILQNMVDGVVLLKRNPT